MSISTFVDLVNNTSFVNNMILILYFILFGFFFYKENRNANSPVQWVDMLVDNKTNRLSLAKFGQFWGISISSWVVIYLAQLPAAYSIFPMVFPAWLAFLGGTWAFNSYVKNKKEDGK